MSLTPTVLFDAYISINSNVVSDHGNKLSMKATIEDLDTTTFGATAKSRTGGLMDGTLDLSFLQDYSASNLDSIFWALLIAHVPVAFEIRPTSSARSATNPAYTGQLLVNAWSPISGDVGKLGALDLSFPCSGVITRATS